LHSLRRFTKRLVYSRSSYTHPKFFIKKLRTYPLGCPPPPSEKAPGPSDSVSATPETFTPQRRRLNRAPVQPRPRRTTPKPHPDQSEDQGATREAEQKINRGATREVWQGKDSRRATPRASAHGSQPAHRPAIHTARGRSRATARARVSQAPNTNRERYRPQVRGNEPVRASPGSIAPPGWTGLFCSSEGTKQRLLPSRHARPTPFATTSTHGCFWRKPALARVSSLIGVRSVTM